MGRNIRFLKSDLEPFRATFKQEVGIGKTRSMMAPYIQAGNENLGGSKYRDRSGSTICESTDTEDWQEAQKRLRERLQARDERSLRCSERRATGIRRVGRSFSGELLEAADPSSEDPRRPTSGPCSTQLRLSDRSKLAEITSDAIELYFGADCNKCAGQIDTGRIRERATCSSPRQFIRSAGSAADVECRRPEETTPANPCSGVEFPVRVKGMFRPHYMTWSEQQRSNSRAPQYLEKRHPDHH